MNPRPLRLRLWLLVAALFAVVSQPVAANENTGPRIALVIGNGEYDAISNLENPQNDARLIRDTLEGLGFEVIYRENADRASMERAVSAFGRRLFEEGPTATGLFYYAGHAVQSNGENFLLPIDVDAQRESDLRFNAVRTSDVMAQMDSSGIGTKIVILDACRSNPFQRTFASNQVGGLSQIGLGSSEFFVAFAATAGNIAEDGTGTHSPYALALAKYLPLNNSEISNTFRLVRNEVSAATNQRQLPETRSTLRRQFFFKGLGDARPEELAAPEPIVEEGNLVEVAAESVVGRWCTPGRAMGFELTINPNELEFRLGRNVRIFEVNSIEVSDDGTVLVEWNQDGDQVTFEFGDFTQSGRLMTQLRGWSDKDQAWQDYNRRLRRCR